MRNSDWHRFATKTNRSLVARVTIVSNIVEGIYGSNIIKLNLVLRRERVFSRGFNLQNSV